MSTDFGNGLEFQVDRELNAVDTSLDSVVFQKRKPPLAEEFNFFQELQSLNRRSALRAQLQSGVIDFTLAGEAYSVLPTRNTFLAELKAANQFAIQNFRAAVDGMIVDVVASRVNGASLPSDLTPSKNERFNVVKLSGPPEDGTTRVDLVFLEVWRAPVGVNPNTVNKPSATTIYKHGNRQYVGTHPADEMIDPAFSIETSKRIQVQYQIRIVESVTLDGYLSAPYEGTPDGVNLGSRVKARGGSVGGADTTYTFSSMWSSGDSGLYRAGDGSLAAKQALKSVDGYVYAIPLVAVARRNKNLTTGYDPVTNPNGSKVSVLDNVASDRPDGLFFDEVAMKDVLDLRHKVMPNNPDFSQILRRNTRQLFAGSLRTKLGTASSGRIVGTDLTDTDTIGSADALTYRFATPDGLRRNFTNEGITQAIVGNFTYPNDQVTGIVQYYNTASPGSVKKIVIDGTSTSSNAIVDFDPAVSGTWPVVSVGGVVKSLVGLSGLGWNYVAGTSQTKAEIILSPADAALFSVGNNVQVQFDVQYPGAGFRSIPEQLHRVKNVSPDATTDFPVEFAFTVDNTNRSVDLAHYLKLSRPGSPNTDHPGVVGVALDNMVDYPVNSFSGVSSGTTDVLKGATRVRQYFVTGTVSNTYSIPKTVDGQKILGIIKILRTVDGVTFTDIDMTSNLSSINKGLSEATNWTVTLTPPVGQSNFVGYTLRFDVILANISAAVNSLVRGVRDFAKDTTLVIPQVINALNLTQEFTTPDNSIILSMPSYEAPNGTLIYYGFVNGIMQQVTLGSSNDGIVSGFGTNKVTVTFTSSIPTNAKLEVPVLSSYTPSTSDLIDFTYTYRPYQGYGSTIPLGECEIVAIGDSLIHTLGTGASNTDGDVKVLGMAQHLPLPSGRTEASLAGLPLGLASSAIDLRDPLEFPDFRSNLLKVDLHNPRFVDTHTGTLPQVGDVIKISSLSSSTPNPERGIADLRLSLAVDLEDVPHILEFNTPYVSELANHQVVWSALVRHPKTSELLMVVLVKMVDASSAGNERTTGDPGTAVAFDVFKISQRPIVTV